LNVYNLKGARIKQIFAGRTLEADQTYFESWNGKDEDNYSVGSGLYLFVLKTENEYYVRKMILNK